jgi:micrococcal nuclease
MNKKVKARKTIILIFSIIFLIFINIVPVENIFLGSKVARSHIDIDTNAKYKVIKVVDGDTIVVEIGNKDVTVRMLGINTPETVDPRKPPECFGKQASDETKRILSGQSVYIETDKIVGEYDKYNRLLAYISLNKNESTNEYLVQNGFAKEYTFDTKKPYSKRDLFKERQKEAKKEKKGLWLECAGKVS